MEEPQAKARAANPYSAAPPARKTLTLVGIYVAVIGSIVQSSSLSTLLPVAVGELGVQGNSIIQVGQNLGSAIGTAVYGAILGVFGVVQGMPISVAVSVVAATVAMVFTLKLRKLEE